MATRKATKPARAGSHAAAPKKAPNKKKAPVQTGKKAQVKVQKGASRSAPSKVIDIMRKPNKSPYKRGDNVQWGSKTKGHEKLKEGVVHSIVKANTRPFADQDELAKLREQFTVMFDIETPTTRRDDTVLVKVVEEGRKPKLYWPLLSHLRSA